MHGVTMKMSSQMLLVIFVFQNCLLFRKLNTPVCKLPSELAVMTGWCVNSPTQTQTPPARTNEALGKEPSSAEELLQSWPVHGIKGGNPTTGLPSGRLVTRPKEVIINFQHQCKDNRQKHVFRNLHIFAPLQVAHNNSLTSAHKVTEVLHC